jgi:hypothetical protein
MLIRKIGIVAAGVLALLSLGACGGAERAQPPPESPGPAGSSLVIDPHLVHAGDSAKLHVESDIVPTLGLDSAMERWTGSEWKLEFTLIKAWQNGPADYAPVGKFINYPEVGLQGFHTWPIIIPKEAEPGQYRIRENVLLETKVLTETDLFAQFEVIE